MSAGAFHESFPYWPDVMAAIHAAFGGKEARDFAAVPGGRSGAGLFSFAVDGRSYVLRRVSPHRPDHAAKVRHEFACMALASERGVGPKVHHLDPESGIAIMDRIAVTPLDRATWSDPAVRRTRIERVARALRRLHQGPPFPPRADREMVRFIDSTLRGFGAPGLPIPLSSSLEEWVALTGRTAVMVPCHYDLNPGNVLTSGEDVFFVDWEVAGQGDPFIDLAQLGVFAFPNPADREALLEAYLERMPNPEERARAIVTRAMALGFYAGAFLVAMAVSGDRTPVESISERPLPFGELLPKLGSGQASPGLVVVSLLEAMAQEVASPAFEDAKTRLASRAPENAS